jgi:hypothetical protein
MITNIAKTSTPCRRFFTTIQQNYLLRPSMNGTMCLMLPSSLAMVAARRRVMSATHDCETGAQLVKQKMPSAYSVTRAAAGLHHVLRGKASGIARFYVDY